MDETCEFCVEEGEVCCDALAPPGADGLVLFACTRAAGHDGPHVACGIDDHALQTWEDK